MTVPITELEEVAALGWRAPVEERLGGWLLRAAGGFTGRANSALAIGEPGVPLAAAARAVQRWYRARGLPPMIAVPYPAGQSEASALDRFLAREGWTIRPGAATVMTARAGDGRLTGRASADAPHVIIETQPDDAWLARYHRGQRRPPEIARRLLGSAPWQAFGSIRTGGEAIAIGRVAVTGEWAGLTAIEVDLRCRRRGLATAMTAALATAAARRGARYLYLQVENGNAAARARYRRAGFAGHHGYHYRVAPSG